MITAIILLLVLLGVVILVDLIIKKTLLNKLSALIKKSKYSWDDVLLRKQVFNRAVHIVPAVLFYYGGALCLKDLPGLVPLFQTVLKLYLLLLVTLGVDALLNAAHEIYRTFEFAVNRPIKSYVQVIKIILYFIALGNPNGTGDFFTVSLVIIKN